MTQTGSKASCVVAAKGLVLQALPYPRSGCCMELKCFSLKVLMEISASRAQWQVGHSLLALNLQTCPAAATAARLQTKSLAVQFNRVLYMAHSSVQNRGLFLRKLSGIKKNNTNFHYF